MTVPAAPLLEVADLRAWYGSTPALHGVSLGVAEGGVATLLGANGAGKTTVLRAICGAVRRQGTVRFAGQRIDALPTESIARLGLAHVPEGRGTFTRLTVSDNLQLGAMSRSDRPAIEADVERTYAWFPRLRERHRQQAGTLSGGEQQMLAVGRALMLRPRLLLLDEPSFGLAPKVIDELFDILAQVREATGVAMLIVEQNAARALELADHACLIETGRIALAGSAADFLGNDEVRRAYLGY